MPMAIQPRNSFEQELVQVSGHVTLDNIEALHRRVQRLLFEADGCPRPYTKVCCYECADYRPEVWTNQKAEQVKLNQEAGRASLTVADTYGVWSISAYLTSIELRGLRSGEARRRAMHVIMDQQQMLIKLRTPEGLKAWWHVALERP